jgi:hypothetical protein
MGLTFVLLRFRYVGRHPQLLLTFELYVGQFIDVVPDVVASYTEATIGPGLAGHLYHYSSVARVSWGVLAEPAPEFYFRTFESFMRERPRFQGQEDLLMDGLRDKIASHRDQLRRQFKAHLSKVQRNKGTKKRCNDLASLRGQSLRIE